MMAEEEGFWENTLWGVFGEGGLLGPEAESSSGPDAFAETREEIKRETRSTQSARAQLDSTLRAYHLDPQAPNILAMLAGIGTDDKSRLEWVNSEEGQAMLLGAASLPDNLLPEYRTTYAMAFQEGGFEGPLRRPEYPDQKTHASMALFDKAGLSEYNENTGFTQFPGVVVTPDMQVIFDPRSNAPGSPKWMQGVWDWGEAKVGSWRDTLVKMGYLPKSSAETRGVDVQFLQALQAYHYNRYAYGGGQAVPSGASESDSRGELLDFKDIRGQITNDVRNQFRNVYGTDPEDSELKAWTQFVVRKASQLQRDFRSEGVPSYSSAAYGEASERFIGKLEEDAAPYREAVEENTSLRDGLAAAAAAIRGL